jgi:hypothetical protein
MSMQDKSDFLHLIRSNIENDGYHVTVVQQSIEPRFAYSIGLHRVLGFELVFAGGAYFVESDLTIIFAEIIAHLKRSRSNTQQSFTTQHLGSFSFSQVDKSWSQLMMLGVFDYFKIDYFKAIQIVPDGGHYTLDIPKMQYEFDPANQPVWQWLVNEWKFGVPESSTVVTNIDVLFGATITELTRWESDEWEMFAGAGPDVNSGDVRIVSLGTILGIDDSVLPSLNLQIGKGMWRSSREDEWKPWG